MAFNLENMTVDYKKLFRMVPSDRFKLAQSGAISDTISSLTPGQLANLFPSYYRDQLPDIGASSGGGGGGASLAGALSGSRLAPFTGRSGGNGTYTSVPPPVPSKSAQEMVVEQILKENGIAQKVAVSPGPKEGGFFGAIMRAEGTDAVSSAKHGFANPYDTVLGYGKYGLPDKPLTEMTISEVYDFQRNTLLKNHGSSSASGAFQIVSDNIFNRRTNDISDFMKKAGLTMNDKFDEAAQRKLAYEIYKAQGLGAWEGFRNHPEEAQKANAEVQNIQIESAAEQIQQLEKLKSELVPLSEDIRKKLDAKTLELYDKATPEQQWNIEHAIGAVGVDKFNEQVKTVAKTTDNVNETAKLISEGTNVNIDEDVMLGKKPFIEGNDFAVPIYTNAKNGKRFDESLSNLTPQAIERLKQQAIAAKAAGLTKLELSGAQTHQGHVSHGSGTETDVVGYNEDGSTWNRDQRAMTALGAVKLGGANRAGLYGSGIVLHVGKADEVQGGPHATGAWGPGGTSGVPLNKFTPGLERDLAAYLKGVGPMPESTALNEHLKKMQEKIEQEKAQAVASTSSVPVSDPVSAALSNVPGQPSQTTTIPGPSLTPVSPTSAPVTTPVTTSAGGNTPVPPPPTPAAMMPTVPTYASGGTIPGENVIGINTDTGKTEFVSNSRELYTKDDNGNLRIDPSTIRQDEKDTQTQPENTQQQNVNAQPLQPPRIPEQPRPVDITDHNFVDSVSSGSMASSPSQLRALNRAKLYSENSSGLFNGHFS